MKRIWRVLLFLMVCGHLSKVTGKFIDQQKKIIPSIINNSVKIKDKLGNVNVAPTLTSTMTTTNRELEHSHQPSMIAVNALNLLFYGTLGTVMPYLPIFYKRLGVSDVNIGMLGAITPAVTFIVSPLWSAFADSTGQHRTIMLITFIGSVLSRCVLAAGTNDLFWLSAVVAVSAFLNAPVKPLLDSAIMSLLTDKSAYGRSRLFGQVGMGLGSFIVDRIVTGNIRVMFFLHLLLAIPTAFLMLIFEPHRPTTKPTTTTTSSPISTATNAKQTIPQPEKIEILKALKHTLGNYKVLIFFLIVFIIGVSSGIIENFAYVRLAEISDGDRSAYGPLRLASSLTGGPMFWISGSIIQKLGVHGVMTLSLISYVIRFIIYGSVRKVWYALPAEMLRGFTFALFWSSATYYVYQIAPKHLTATMLGILNAIYGGLGQSLGSLIGGELSKRFGIKLSFYYCALVDFLILVGFILYQTILHITDSINGNGNGNDKGNSGGNSNVSDKESLLDKAKSAKSK